MERLRRILGLRREETMAKAKENKGIEFTKNGDAFDPRPAPWGYIGRLPLPVSVPPSGERIVRLGVSTDVPLLAFPGKTWPDILPVKQIFSPGEEIVIVVKNPSAHTIMTLESGEAVVCLHPLTFG